MYHGQYYAPAILEIELLQLQIRVIVTAGSKQYPCARGPPLKCCVPGPRSPAWPLSLAAPTMSAFGMSAVPGCIRYTAQLLISRQQKNRKL